MAESIAFGFFHVLRPIGQDHAYRTASLHTFRKDGFRRVETAKLPTFEKKIKRTTFFCSFR
jgi:hypothetical protein